MSYLLNIEERLLKYSDRSGECWLWVSAIDIGGYGVLWDKRRKNNSKAHRLAWEVWRGPVREDQDVHHKCRVRSCINPKHLTPIDPFQHNSDHHTKTECVHGHPYTPENTYVYDNRYRGRQKVCRTCQKAAGKRWAKQNRAKINAYKRKRYRERKEQESAG